MNEERFYWIDKQCIDLHDLECKGTVLDIGGGGEGIIGQILTDQVVAIDPDESELIEAPDGPLKVIMDARELKFLANTFRTVTSFFTLMYIGKEDHQKVFREIYRVLQPGGELLLWEVLIPEFSGGQKDVFVVPLEIQLPNQIVETGYGVLWPGRVQSQEYYKEIAQQVGFALVFEESPGKETFFLKWVK